MAISQDLLRQKARTVVKGAATETLNEALVAGRKTAFLCHSHTDRDLAEGFANYAKELGWDVYIDWQDNSLPSKPNVETAKAIQSEIEARTAFLFLATENSMASQWCPWEIGYADGVKGRGAVIIIPTKDSTHTYGGEYLELYPRIDNAEKGELGRFDPGTSQGVTLKSFKVK